MSMYLSPLNVINRLHDDWEKHGKLIIAVDFDSTIYPYFENEKAYELDFQRIRLLLKQLTEAGCHIIINTSAEESRWEGIKTILHELGVSWNFFNQSPHYIPGVQSIGKVYANAYLDDRGGLWEIYMALRLVLAERKLANQIKNIQEMGRQLSQL